MTSNNSNVKKKTNNSAQLNFWRALSLILLVATLFLVSNQYLQNGSLNDTNIVQIQEQESKQDQLSQIKKLIDENFVGSAVEPISNKAESVLKNYVNSLGDPYSVYLTPEETEVLKNDINAEFVGIGARFDDSTEYRIIEVFKDSPAERAGIEPEDVLLEVDGTNITEFPTFEQVRALITGPEGSQVALKVKRDTTEVDIVAIRGLVNVPIVTIDYIDKYAYISITTFGQSLDQELEKIAKQIKEKPEIESIILDLRNNTGGYLDQAIDLISYFVPPNTKLLYEKEKDSEKSHSSTFKSDNLEDKGLYLVSNKFSASASEITLAALKELRGAKIIGEKSFGKGVVQELFGLDDGGTLKLTVSEWLGPNKTPINKVGIDADIPMTQDELLSEDVKNIVIQKIQNQNQ